MHQVAHVANAPSSARKARPFDPTPLSPLLDARPPQPPELPAHASANTTPSATYTPSRTPPSCQVDLPSRVTNAAIAPAATRAATSYPLNTRAIGCGPSANERSTRRETTNIAIWTLDPIAMFRARSILSFIATTTAAQCSAAFPPLPTTNTPMKERDSPTARDAT